MQNHPPPFLHKLKRFWFNNPLCVIFSIWAKVITGFLAHEVDVVRPTRESAGQAHQRIGGSSWASRWRFPGLEILLRDPAPDPKPKCLSGKQENVDFNTLFLLSAACGSELTNAPRKPPSKPWLKHCLLSCWRGSGDWGGLLNMLLHGCKNKVLLFLR